MALFVSVGFPSVLSHSAPDPVPVPFKLAFGVSVIISSVRICRSVPHPFLFHRSLWRAHLYVLVRSHFGSSFSTSTCLTAGLAAPLHRIIRDDLAVAMKKGAMKKVSAMKAMKTVAVKKGALKKASAMKAMKNGMKTVMKKRMMA